MGYDGVVGDGGVVGSSRPAEGGNVRSLEGRVALVTGGATGIGRGIVRKLALDGASIVVNFRSRKDEAHALVDELRASGTTAICLPADISDVGDVRQLYDRTETSLGPVDICVANAAQFLQRAIVDVSEDDFDRVFTTNVKGSFFVMQQAARRMGRGGRIIAISATGPSKPQALRSVYHASKAALEHFVKVLAIEAGPRGITVNAVAPGVTRTEGMTERNPTLAQQSAAETPLGRIGEIEDIADVVAFVASEAARWITGQVIRANGGLS